MSLLLSSSYWTPPRTVTQKSFHGVLQSGRALLQCNIKRSQQSVPNFNFPQKLLEGVKVRGLELQEQNWNHTTVQPSLIWVIYRAILRQKKQKTASLWAALPAKQLPACTWLAVCLNLWSFIKNDYYHIFTLSENKVCLSYGCLHSFDYKLCLDVLCKGLNKNGI